MKNKAAANVNSIIDSLPTDRVNESNNNNDEKFHAIVPESCQNSCMTQKLNRCHVKRKHNEVFCGMDSNHSFFYDDILHANFFNKNYFMH